MKNFYTTLKNKLKQFIKNYPRASFMLYWVYGLLKINILRFKAIIFKCFIPYRKLLIKRSIKRYQKLSPTEKEAIHRDLSRFSLDNKDGGIISFVGASRRNHNPNNRLDEFLCSLIEKTKIISSVEVLVRIDDTDDLLYYQQIKKRFGQRIRLRFLIGKSDPKGYQKLHIFVSELLNYLSDTAEIVVGFADDCIIDLENWDLFFYNVLLNYTDNIFFINTTRDFSISYLNKNVLFWLMWQQGPPSLFTALGRRVLEITDRIAKKHPGWSAFGNSVMCDSFIEALQFYLWEMTGVKRAPALPNAIRIQAELTIAPHKEGGLFSESPVALRGYKEFLKNSTQTVIKEMAEEIAMVLNCPAKNSHPFKNYEEFLNKIVTSKETSMTVPLRSPVTNPNKVISFMVRLNDMMPKTNNFFDSLITHTAELERLEILIWGNLEHKHHYHDLYQKYGEKVRMCFIPEIKGMAQNTQVTWLTQISVSAQIIIFCTDNCKINKKHWDVMVVDCIDKKLNEKFFIDLFHNNNDYSNPLLFFWELWRNELPTRFVYAISKRALELITNKAANAASISSWLHNRFYIDLFFAALKLHLFAISARDISLPLDNFCEMLPREKKTQFHYSYQEYFDFLSEEIQNSIRKIALNVNREMMSQQIKTVTDTHETLEDANSR